MSAPVSAMEKRPSSRVCRKASTSASKRVEVVRAPRRAWRRRRGRARRRSPAASNWRDLLGGERAGTGPAWSVHSKPCSTGGGCMPRNVTDYVPPDRRRGGTSDLPSDPVGDRHRGHPRRARHRGPSRPRAGRAVGALRQQGRAGTPASCAAAPPVGVVATQDADALLDLDADCICYTANSDLRPDGVIDDICRMLAVRQERGEHVVRAAAVPEGGRRRRVRPAPGRVPRGRHQLLHLGHRPGLRQRRHHRPRARALQGGAHGPDAGDRELRHLGQPLHDVRDHGLREAGPVAVAAAVARAPSSLAWGPVLAPRGRGASALAARLASRRRTRSSAPTRTSTIASGHRREGDHLGHALRDHRHGRRRGAHRRRARHPPARRRRPRLAPGRRLPDPRSRASRT